MDRTIPPMSEHPALLHEFFERSSRQWPQRIALDVPPGTDRVDRQTFTYSELYDEAEQLAVLLRQYVSGECIVALMLPRTSQHLLVSQLATLRAGAAYACIDPSFPDGQVSDIVSDSDAVVVLTDAPGLERARRLGVTQALDITAARPRVSPPTDQPSWLTPETLAYVIYTSGTTGRPKGVMIEHRSIANLVASDIDEFQLTPEDRIAQGSSAAYDSSVEEIWLGFAVGATVVVMDDETARLGPDLIEWLQRERITVFCPPPTLLRATGCESPDNALPDVRLVYVGGEALPRDVADRWARGRRLENGYGPTEVSVTSLRTTIRENDVITIGYPVRGLKAWVLNDELKELPDGEQGELCLGGIGLARGYRNRKDLTASKFPEHPTLGRIYRTGDLVHRQPDGRYVYHGRIDTQVKVRGYRIELEAIEARLSESPFVRQAACTVQENGLQQSLVAFVVPEPGKQPASNEDLKEFLRARLPSYMVPAKIALIDTLPTTVGGKLNRRALPTLDFQRSTPITAPRNELEGKLERGFRQVLRLSEAAGLEEDFFHDLGGSSLQAAELISLLRKDSATASLTVRDLYQSRTIEQLALRAAADAGPERNINEIRDTPALHPAVASTLQAVWLVIGLVVWSLGTWFAAFEVLPWFIERMGLIPFLVLSPILFILAGAFYVPLSVLTLVVIKRILIGRYRPLKAPVWGSFYIRNWMVQVSTQIVPWLIVEGTVFQNIALRMLGARIGRRVHIHRGVDLRRGGWDLLEIGDDVTLSQDSAVRLVDLRDGEVVVAPVTIGSGSTLDIRAGIGGNTVLEPDSFVTALSYLEDGGHIGRGESWAGIPARYVGPSPPRPELTENRGELSEVMAGLIQLLTSALWVLVISLPYELPVILVAIFSGVDTGGALNWLENPSLEPGSLSAVVLLFTAPLPIMLLLEALVLRAAGTVKPGVINRLSLGYVRVWLKSQAVQSAGEWLSGTLFWPIWLRMAGMKVGKGCEISTIIDVVPELNSIGPTSFFADGIYLGGPFIHRGTVSLRRTSLGENTFLGNHSVIGSGQNLPDDVLLGVCTVADDGIMRAGTAWFGQPPFELPVREVVECDRSLTHEPSFIRYWNRVFWELLRFALPAVLVLTIVYWYRAASLAEAEMTKLKFLLIGMPLLNFLVPAFLCALILFMKWFLLGKVRPGIHPLWSCWCSRWDFLYVAWGIFAHASLTLLEGTEFLVWYLRAMGMKIGRRVVMGTGFAQVVDPDMLHFEDGATVTCQFQAHTFEDRVLKIDHVRIGPRSTVGHSAVLLYGANIGEGATVAAHSVVMKREHLLPGRNYAGSPTRPV